MAAVEIVDANFEIVDANFESDFTPATVEQHLHQETGVQRQEAADVFTNGEKPMTDPVEQKLNVFIRFVILIGMAANLKSKSSKPGVGFDPKYRALKKVVESTSASDEDKIATLKECCLLLMEKFATNYFTLFGNEKSRLTQIGDLANLVVTVVGDRSIEHVLYQMFDFNELDRAARFFYKGTEFVDFKVDELNLTGEQVPELRDIVINLAFKMNPLAEKLQAAEESNQELSGRNAELVEVCRKLETKNADLLKAIDISTSRISALEGDLETSQADCDALLSQLEEAAGAPPSSPNAGAAGSADGASAK
jgi:hypothetical protein